LADEKLNFDIVIEFNNFKVIIQQQKMNLWSFMLSIVISLPF